MTMRPISNKLIFWLACCILLGLLLPLSASAADSSVGVAYRGHIQDLGDYPTDGSWVDSPEVIGTRGQSKRIEGFEIKLTDDIPAGMELRYNVHVQNKGWLYDEDDPADWPKDGDYAGTRGESLRIEAVKIVLTDADGQPVTGYSVQYRGHVQNVGDLPADETQWLADGDQLGTVGSSQRLEALLVQVVKTAVEPVEPMVYDTAGTYGPATGTETIAGDVTVNADGVTLQNLKIDGDLTIAEAVGNGTVTLNNVTVAGDTFVRGGGKNSIHINGGQYSRIIMEKTPNGAVRIVATDVDGLEVVISEDASGETIILEGAFDSVTVNAPNMIITTQGNTTIIGKMTVGAAGAGSTVTLNAGTTVSDLVLDGKAAVKGQGTVTKAEVKADGVTFDKAPGSYTVEPGVVIPPVFPTPDNGGGSGGGYTPPASVAVTGVSLNKTAVTLSVNVTETLVATVAPAGATNKAVTWTTSDATIATIAADGKVTGLKEGQATITVTTQDGNKTAAGVVTVKDLQSAIAGVTVPFAGEAPVTAITGTNQYTGTVSWQKKDGSNLTALAASDKFDGSSTYLATITLSLLAPYIPADIPANFFTVAGATATNGAGALVITAEFLPTNQYKITDLGVITAYSGPGGDVLVPAMVNNKVVKEIGANAFNGQSAITAITLPATVAAIGSSAFVNCTGLTAVTFDPLAELKTIGTGAFAYCQLLTSITIPDQVTEIGASAFIGCTKLHTVTISANSALKSIGINAFNNCAALTAINIPADLTSLGAAAFVYCSALKTVTIAGNLTAIGDHTFNGCSALESIIIPESVTSIGNSAFNDCQKLTTIAIPEKVTALGLNAIKNCTGLTSVSFTGTPMLKTIGQEAFYGCTKLTAIEIPKPVTALGNRAFSVCTALSTITFRGPTPSLGADAIANGTMIRHYANYSGYDGWAGCSFEHILAAPVQTALQIANSGTGTASVTVNWGTVMGATGYDVFVSETTATYGDAKASVASGVTTTTITGLDSSKTYYFTVKAKDAYGESLPSNEITADLNIAVTGVTVSPATVPLLVVDASTTLTATVAPANAANQAVTWSSDNDNVATVSDTGVVKAVAEGSATITVKTTDGAKEASCTVTVKPVFEATASGSPGTITKYNGNETAVVIPETIGEVPVTAIGADAFNNNDAVQSVTIPATVTSIGATAFLDCDYLNKVTFAGTSELVTIGANAFERCVRLANITLPPNLTTIGTKAFLNCYALTAVSIPSEVSTIGVAAFQSCYALSAVSFAADSSLTKIDENAFSQCPITTLTLPDKLQTIGNNAFYFNRLTGTLIIPATVTSIGEMAFERKTGVGGTPVTTLEIKATPLTIGNKAFKNQELTSIIIPAGVTISADTETMGTYGSKFRDAYTGGGNYTYNTGTGNWIH